MPASPFDTLLTEATVRRIAGFEYRNGPSLARYQTLESFARKADDWEDWREQALAYLRRRLGEPQPEAERHDGKRDRTPLVEIFLYEERTDEAWEEAQEGGCSDRLWLQLAALRAKSHPADAAPIYLRLAEKEILHAQSSRYEPAVKLLEQAAPLMKSLGRSAEFVEYVEALRLRYKPKRNLQKLIESRRLHLYFG